MNLEERILILAPLGEDAANAASVLSGVNISSEACLNLVELQEKLSIGAGAILITEESLTSSETSSFVKSLREQESWSDIPIIIITSGGEATALSVDMVNLFDTVGNINLLERPLRVITLVSAVQVALRARRRQYQIKHLLQISQQAEQEIERYAQELLENNKDLQQFASIVESSDDAIISKDLKGIVISWNNAAQRIFGYEAQEMIGKSINKLIPKDRYNEEPVFIERIKRGEKIDHYDTVRQRKDGSLIDISLTISPVRDEKGVIVGASKIARDITQRKKDEKELKSLTSDLEKRVEERTQLLEEHAGRLRQLAVELTEVEQSERRRLAEVLHDHLQQYLVAAKMRLDLMQIKSDGADKRNLLDALSFIQQSIDSSRLLTAELRPPVLYEGGLNAGLRYLAQKMKNQHKLQVHLSVGDNTEPQTDLIKVMIYQCVQEMLFNAVKYAKVSECFVNVARIENNTIEVTVEDKGIGFNTSHIGSVHKGGFGLFSIRERVKALGGELRISSIQGFGSVFTLTIPDKLEIIPAEKTKPPLEKKYLAREKVQGEGIVVLVADDHPIIRQSIASLLLSQSFIKEVVEAENGQDALRQAEAHEPDIILMDINMPVLNGIEATQILLNRNPRYKIIGLSVQTKSEMAQTMKDVGAVAFFNKGDDTNDLIETIKKFSSQQFSSI